MQLQFERGSLSEPKGHALVYFQDTASPGRLVATCFVVLPVAIDVAKYIPPMFATQMGSMGLQDISAFAFPPVPEEMESHTQVKRLARLRDDDLIFGGTLDMNDMQAVLTTVNDGVQAYAQAYRDYHQSVPAEEAATGPSVEEVLFELMSPRARLGELSKLLGKLRFAVDGGDQRLVEEVQEEIQALSRHLPEHYRLEAMMTAAQSPGPQGGKLAQLYLERCYKLVDEDYLQAQEIEKAIAQLEMAG